MSNELRVFAFIAMCLFLAYVGLVAHTVHGLKTKPKSKSLEGEK